jgi:hypothetical protein
MKVTVRFGAIRIVVPCNGEILVQDLIRESIRRYKNATGKVRMFFYIFSNKLIKYDNLFISHTSEQTEVGRQKEYFSF